VKTEHVLSTLKLFFAVSQSFLALAAFILGLLLHFNVLEASLLNLPDQTQSLYVLWLGIFGAVFLISGLFLFYEWREEG
jgi:hypothetical protein